MSAETSTITSTTMSKSCSSGSASRAFRTAVNVHAFLAFRFAAQYFFIRTLTAFRAAADIPRRRRTSFFAASRPESFAIMNESGSSSLSNESRRCGNNSTSSLTSCFKSSRRASAPRLASAKILDECFAIDASISNKRVRRHVCQLSSQRRTSASTRLRQRLSGRYAVSASIGCSTACKSSSRSTGFTKWRWNPASLVRSRSDDCP